MVASARVLQLRSESAPEKEGAMPPQVIEAEPKPKAAVPPAPGPFAPLPHDIEIEDQHASALNEENLARLALIDPERVATRITARERSLELLRVACHRGVGASQDPGGAFSTADLADDAARL